STRSSLGLTKIPKLREKTKENKNRERERDEVVRSMASVLQERMETLLAVSHWIRRHRRPHHQAHGWTHRGRRQELQVCPTTQAVIY
ncbi:unnamed protein product, partial [Arabidopsis halleri]